MNHRLTLTALFLLGAAGAYAIEGTARPVVSAAKELEAMRLVPVCPPGTPVAVSGTRFICGQPPAPVTPTTPTLSCRVITGNATCAAGESLTGGGCADTPRSGTGNNSSPAVTSAIPLGNRMSCGSINVPAAYSICCRIQ
jgi:hypothetical protein